MQTAFAIYFTIAAAATVVLAVLLAAADLRARRGRSRDAVLRNRYLQIVVTALASEGEVSPRFPLIRRTGARLLLAETVAGVVSVTYGLDDVPLRRIVGDNQLDEWLLRRVRRSQGFRRARLLALLSALPAGDETADRLAPYVRSRNRYVRFYALMARLAADPSTALRLMADYPGIFSACEVAEIMAVLRRGMLPIAYEPLVLSPNRNLRKLGLSIVRQFGIEQAEERLLRIVERDPVPELGREALYTLCSMRRPLMHSEVVRRIGQMDAAERRALMRYMAQEGYAPEALRPLLGGPERPYFDSLVSSYKRSLA